MSFLIKVLTGVAIIAALNGLAAPLAAQVDSRAGV